MKCYWFGALAAMPMLFFLLDAGTQAGAAKTNAWKPFLSEAAYQELTQRSIKAIEEQAKAGSDKIQVEAALLVGYTLSVKNPDAAAVAKLRGAALAAAAAAQKNDAKKLADFGKSIPAAPNPPPNIKDFTKVLSATEPMMKGFLSKAKGGEGIHVVLQYQPKLKNLNGIEALISTLAAKKISDENLARIAKELPNLAYRVAVMGSITHEFTPKKDADKWREFSLTMRDQAIALAEAAHQKDAAGVMKSALALENSCIECHSVFKNK